MDDAAQTRRREIATEHLLFKLMEFVEARHPGLLDFLRLASTILAILQTARTRTTRRCARSRAA